MTKPIHEPMKLNILIFFQIKKSILYSFIAVLFFNFGLKAQGISLDLDSTDDYVDLGSTAKTGTGFRANYHFNQRSPSEANPGVTNLTDPSGNGNNGALDAFALSGSISNWAGVHELTNDVFCGVYDPEINLAGNGSSIIDGDVTLSLIDFTVNLITFNFRTMSKYF